MKIIRADPAKNITVFILDSVDDPADRAALAREILAEKSLGAEQVGFVIPPPGAAAFWRLEMAGGEFCGNATRSFGLYAARQQGLKGKAKLQVSVSGTDGPVTVEVDTENGWAAAEMPKPTACSMLDYRNLSLPLLVFEGISHVIALDLEADRETVFAIKTLLEKKFPAPPALGVLFYDTASRVMRPAIYVYSVDSLVFESSCGSGSAAMGAWLSRDLRDGNASYPITQSGGVIETKVVKRAGEIIGLTIGGEVKLGEAVEFESKKVKSKK